MVMVEIFHAPVEPTFFSTTTLGRCPEVVCRRVQISVLKSTFRIQCDSDPGSPGDPDEDGS